MLTLKNKYKFLYIFLTQFLYFSCCVTRSVDLFAYLKLYSTVHTTSTLHTVCLQAVYVPLLKYLRNYDTVSFILSIKKGAALAFASGRQDFSYHLIYRARRGGGGADNSEDLKF
jgi:hypothetical protein